MKPAAVMSDGMYASVLSGQGFKLKPTAVRNTLAVSVDIENKQVDLALTQVKKY
jgi:hypothetical protein